MNTVLKFINKSIKPNGKSFFWYIVILVVSNLFFHILYFGIFLATLFWKIKFLPRIFKIFVIILFAALMIGLNITQLFAYSNLQLVSDNSSILNSLVLLIEIFHFTAFSLFFYCIYNIIFLRNSPSSLIYFGLYNLLHAIFNNCPVISLQNFLNPAAGNGQFKNEFWQGFFGSYTDYMRIFIGFVSIVLFYLAFLQLKNLNHKIKFLDIYFPWLDRKLNQSKINLEVS